MQQNSQLKILQMLSDLDDVVKLMGEGPFEYIFHYKQYLHIRDELDSIIVKSFYTQHESNT